MPPPRVFPLCVTGTAFFVSFYSYYFPVITNPNLNSFLLPTLPPFYLPPSPSLLFLPLPPSPPASHYHSFFPLPFLLLFLTLHSFATIPLPFPPSPIFSFSLCTLHIRRQVPVPSLPRTLEAALLSCQDHWSPCLALGAGCCSHRKINLQVIFHGA